MYYVYALVDPFFALPFYIGKGKNDRAFQHLKGRSKENVRKNAAIQTIRDLGEEPLVFFLEETENEADAYDLEWQYIQAFKQHLTNRVGVDLRPPSRKGKTMPESAKRKISAYNKGKVRGPLSYERKEKLRLSRLGKPGPNKAHVCVTELADFYKTHTKAECMKRFGIGPGSLNRILAENKIYKSNYQ